MKMVLVDAFNLLRLARRFGIGQALRFAWQRLRKVHAIKFPVDGVWLQMPNERLALHYIIESVPKLRNLVLAVPSDDARIVFDVGANAGLFSALAHIRWPNARIYAFEPSPEMCAFIGANNPGDYIEIIERAVVGIDGVSMELFVNEAAQQTNSLFRDAADQFRAKGDSQRIHVVGSITIDTFCANRGIKWIDVMKIDIQGAESEMLLGATRMLQATESILVEATFLDPDPLAIPKKLSQFFSSGRVVNLVAGGADLLYLRKS